MKRLQKLILAIGLVFLISGTTIIIATATGLIPNKRYYSTTIELSAPQLTPKEFTFFHDVLDEGDKVNVHIEVGPYSPTDISVEMAMARKGLFNLSVYIRDSQNDTLRHEEYSSESLDEERAWEGARLFPMAYPLEDMFFQVPEYDKYRMTVVYEAWILEQEYYSWENRGPWYLVNITGTISDMLWSDIEIEKPTPNLTFMLAGFIVLSIGVVLITASFLKKFK